MDKHKNPGSLVLNVPGTGNPSIPSNPRPEMKYKDFITLPVNPLNPLIW